VKVLFLDIDGVLNSREVITKRGRGDVVCLEMVERINRVIRATDCKIAISSSWRIAHSLRWLKAFLRQYLIIDVIVDKTPTSDKGRGYEILLWLLVNPQVECYAIVDDDSFDMEEVKHRLVRTDFLTGIADEHVEQLIKLLNEEENGSQVS
jgi:hypothetical protein